LYFLPTGRSVAAEGVKEPGAGEGPLAVGGAAGQPKGRGGFVQRHSRKKAEFHEFGAFEMSAGQAPESVVQIRLQPLPWSP
jgi:hypothetical protein